METILSGVLCYDVPVANKSAYAKLRALLKRKAVMQTASSYLFPWGMASLIEDGIKNINTASDGMLLPPHMRVDYCLFKFDEEVSGQALRQSAMSALDKLLANAKDAVNKHISTLKEEDLITDDNVKTAKSACRRAHSKLRDARALALLFNLTNDMNAGFLAYEAYIMAKREEIDQANKF